MINTLQETIDHIKKDNVKRFHFVANRLTHICYRVPDWRIGPLVTVCGCNVTTVTHGLGGEYSEKFRDGWTEADKLLAFYEFLKPSYHVICERCLRIVNKIGLEKFKELSLKIPVTNTEEPTNKPINIHIKIDENGVEVKTDNTTRKFKDTKDMHLYFIGYLDRVCDSVR